MWQTGNKSWSVYARVFYVHKSILPTLINIQVTARSLSERLWPGIMDGLQEHPPYRSKTRQVYNCSFCHQLELTDRHLPDKAPFNMLKSLHEL